MRANDSLNEACAARNEGRPGPRRSSESIVREFADEHSRARQAAAMADADHRHPSRLRDLYLENAPAPLLSTTGLIAVGSHEAAKRMRQVAVAFKFTGLVAVLGLIATIVLTA